MTLADPMDAGGCRADARLTDGVAVVRMLGTAENEALDALDAFVTRVHDAVVAAGLKAVRVEMRGLEFMSSSSLKSMVRWLLRVEELLEPQRYVVTFVPRPASHWQARSLRALQSLAPQVVVVE
jgi:hypothetical protein